MKKFVAIFGVFISVFVGLVIGFKGIVPAEAEVEVVEHKDLQVEADLRNIQFLNDECARSARRSGAYLHNVHTSVVAAAEHYKLEDELLLAVIVAESRCRSWVRSRKGAIGLMQLMPRTARWLGVEDPQGVQSNIFGGAKYLSYLLDKFEGNKELAVAAYNAGPSPVKRYRAVPPYRETVKYVKQVLNYYSDLQNTGLEPA